MQIFKFGPLVRVVNRKGEEHEAGKFGLHIQCSWRLVNNTEIVFGKGDLYDPHDESIPLGDFDYNKRKSRLDVRQREWFATHRDNPLCVVSAVGDAYGGFRIELERRFLLEAFPSASLQKDENEHWRFTGHRPDHSHFVITGSGEYDA